MQLTSTLRLTGLWRDSAFLKLWTAQSVSALGDQVTLLALQLTAIDVLGAGPVEMGLLRSAQFVPYLVLGLPAGLWLDFHARRPVLIVTDLGRAVLLSTIPAAALLGRLSLLHLLVVALGAATLRMLFDLAHRAYVPSLVARPQLVEANSKLWTSTSFAQVVGPALAGGLVQAVGGPLAIVADAISFVGSAACLSRIRSTEPERPTPASDDTLRGSLWEGLRFLGAHPVLRAVAGCNGTFNFFFGIWGAGFVLYLTRDLRMTPSVLGLALAATGPGAVLGSVLAPRLARWAGLGRTIVVSFVVGSASLLLVPLAGAIPIPDGLLVAASQFVFGVTSPVYNINQGSVRQALTPNHLLGRTGAAQSFISWGTIPVGALVGGLLGEVLGLRASLFIAVIGGLLASGWLLRSPVPSLRVVPATKA